MLFTIHFSKYLIMDYLNYQQLGLQSFSITPQIC